MLGFCCLAFLTDKIRVIDCGEGEHAEKTGSMTAGVTAACSAEVMKSNQCKMSSKEAEK